MSGDGIPLNSTAHPDWPAHVCVIPERYADGSYHCKECTEPMAHPMIERIAKALYEKLAAYTLPTEAVAVDAFENESDFRKNQMRDWARAAIEAMREPTEDMYRAGAKGVCQVDRGDYESVGYLPERVIDFLTPSWRAMIDQVLSGTLE